MTNYTEDLTDMARVKEMLNLTEIPKPVPGTAEDFLRTIDPDLIDTDRVSVYGNMTKEELRRRVMEARAKPPVEVVKAGDWKRIAEIFDTNDIKDVSVTTTDGEQIQFAMGEDPAENIDDAFDNSRYISVTTKDGKRFRFDCE